MNRYRRARPLAALLIAAVLGPGCTAFDDYVSGTPFSLEPPLEQVTVAGGINVDPSGSTDSCGSGQTVLWGLARNTGDVDLVDVSIEIDAYDAAGNFLGTYAGGIFSGTVTGGEDETEPVVAATSLLVDQSGSFEICAPLAYGTVARTEYRTYFVHIEESEG